MNHRPSATAKWDVEWKRRLGSGHWVTPPRLFGGSFALLIVLGTLGLKWLPGLYISEELNWLDATFTATSAVCVTGLIVVDTATYFTLAGQAWILLLIQLGGLGMIAFSSIIIVALGRRLSLKQEALTSEVHLAAPHVDMRRLTLNVLGFTLGFEAVGAACLYVLWFEQLGWTGALWPAIFHSVSAFCNAGFSTFSDNLIGFQSSPATLAVIGSLIVTGGLGFLTLEELNMLRHERGQGRTVRLSLHSRIVLSATAVLIVAGWMLFAAFEVEHTLAPLSRSDQAVNSLFMSVTARTAGFASIDYAEASDSANLLTIILMTIGGSPGSTAGGVKTTTFALIGLIAWARLRGFQTTTFASRSIRKETTERAVGLFVIAFGVMTTGMLLLTATEGQDGRFLERLFEVASGFNTVGLSMGETAMLSRSGRTLMIALMFLGRVGLLTMAAALAVRQLGRNRFRYAYEEVVVG